MTEPANSTSRQREQIEAALDDAQQQQRNLERAIRLQLTQGWQSRAELNSLPLNAAIYAGGGVALTPKESNTSASGPVILLYDVDHDLDPHVMDGRDSSALSSREAADRLGIDVEAMNRAASGVSALVAADVTLHRTLRELETIRIPQLEQDLEDLANAERDRNREANARAIAANEESRARIAGDEPRQFEWATDSLDAPYTPERVAADWVQSTTMVRTYLESGRPDLAREWIETLDENLTSFSEGDVPPGSDELEDVYHDAVARAAIPYGHAPIRIEEVRWQLGAAGRAVPELDVESIRQSTGIVPLDPGVVARGLDQGSRVPEGMEGVAAARLSVRRAIASISEDSESAQEYLSTANRTLSQALEGMRPDKDRDSVVAAQESVQNASEKVSAVADTAAKVEAEVTVYTTDGCPGCFATKRVLDKAGVEYDEIPLQDHPELLAQFKRQLGKENEKITAPVVQTRDGDLWSGYNPGKLKEHGLDHRTRQQRSGETGRDTGYGR